jgi:hypothetical protein
MVVEIELNSISDRRFWSVFHVSCVFLLALFTSSRA